MRGHNSEGTNSSQEQIKSEHLSVPNDRLQRYLPDVIIDLIQSYNSDEPFSDHLIPPVPGDNQDSYNSYMSSLNLFGMEKLFLAGKAMDLFLWGRVDEAIRIMETFPHLFTVVVERVGPSGTVKDTFYGHALFTDDQYILDKDGNTAIDRAKNLLIKHYGEAEEQKQRQARFPQGWGEEEKAKVKEYSEGFDAVAKVFDESKAITKGELEEDKSLQDAIQNFKNFLTPKGINRSGRCCMHQLWDYAAKFYDEQKYLAYGGFGTAKNNLFCRKILGTIDLRLPAWCMQVLEHGIDYANVRSDPVLRANVIYHFNVSASNNYILGNDYFMGLIGSSEGRPGGCSITAARRKPHATFSNFCEKQQNVRATKSQCYEFKVTG